MPHFTPRAFAFLEDLAVHNDRDWFTANKPRYEADLRDPALRFIADFGPYLHAISPHFLAVAKAQGGSLFRIQRDTRFSADKAPYKTNTGVQFRHEQGQDAHCPGFYLHIQPGDCIAGVGIWMPDAATLGRVRDAIVRRADEWAHLKGDLAAAGLAFMDGDPLKRPPRGYDPEHPHVEDLKRRSIAVSRAFDDAQVASPSFIDDYARACRDGAPLVRFICEAIGIPF